MVSLPGELRLLGRGNASAPVWTPCWDPLWFFSTAPCVAGQARKDQVESKEGCNVAPLSLGPSSLVSTTFLFPGCSHHLAPTTAVLCPLILIPTLLALFIDKETQVSGFCDVPSNWQSQDVSSDCLAPIHHLLSSFF